MQTATPIYNAFMELANTCVPWVANNDKLSLDLVHSTILFTIMRDSTTTQNNNYTDTRVDKCVYKYTQRHTDVTQTCHMKL